MRVSQVIQGHGEVAAKNTASRERRKSVLDGVDILVRLLASCQERRPSMTLPLGIGIYVEPQQIRYGGRDSEDNGQHCRFKVSVSIVSKSNPQRLLK